MCVISLFLLTKSQRYQACMHVLVQQHCDQCISCELCKFVILQLKSLEFFLEMMKLQPLKRVITYNKLRLTCYSIKIISPLLDSIIHICCYFKFQHILRRNDTLSWINRKQRIWTNL